MLMLRGAAGVLHQSPVLLVNAVRSSEDVVVWRRVVVLVEKIFICWNFLIFFLN